MILYFPILLSLIVVPSMSEGLELPRSLLLILFCFTYLIIKPDYLFVSKKFLYLPLLIPVIYLINAIFLEPNILQVLFGTWKRNFGVLTHLAIAILFLVSVNSKSLNSNKLFKNCLLPLTVISIIYSLVQISGNDFLLWLEKDRVVLTSGNSNYAAVYLALMLPGAIYAFFKQRDKNIILYKAVFFMIFIFIIYCGLKTMSFQFNVIALTALTTYLFIFYYDKFIKLTLKFRVLSITFLFFTTIGLIIRYRNILNEFTSADDRISTQRIGLEIFKDNFFTGVGVENTSSFAQLYVKPEDIRREGADRFLDKSHNSLIDHFANGGVFLGLAYMTFIVTIFYFIYRLLKANYKIKEELALLGSIFSSYVIQLFFNTDSILLMVIPHIVMGMIGKLYLEASSHYLNSELVTTRQSIVKPRPKNQLIATRLIMSLLMFIVLVFGNRIVSTDIQFQQIFQGKVTSGDKIMETLNNWPYQRPTEKVMVEIAQNLENCSFLESVANRLVDVNQRSNEAWLVKSLCADFKGNQKLALIYVQKALDLHPLNIRYLDVRYQLEIALGLNLKANATLDLIKSIVTPKTEK